MEGRDIKKIMKKEKNLYLGNLCKRFYMQVLCEERFLIWKYLHYLRKEEYYITKKSKLLKAFYRRKRNILGNKINLKIMPFYADEQINIHHKGIIVNGQLGKNVILHGSNCIGNNTMGGYKQDEIPKIGDNVDIGYGANIFGKVEIADNVKIGANSLVIKSITEEGTVWGGVPAHKIR